MNPQKKELLWGLWVCCIESVVDVETLAAPAAQASSDVKAVMSLRVLDNTGFGMSVLANIPKQSPLPTP